MIGLSQLFRLPQSHHSLMLVEVLHLELLSEFEDLLCLALPLRSTTYLLPETFVQLLEVFLLLPTAHEEQRRQLRVLSFEPLPLLGRKHLYVVRHRKLLPPFLPLLLSLLSFLSLLLSFFLLLGLFAG